MPWKVVENHAACPSGKPHAVVKIGEEEKPVGCHPNRAAADAQVAALYENAAPEEESAAVIDGGPAWVAPGGIVMEGETTGDGRRIEAGALEWLDPDEVLIPLRWQKEDRPGHEGAVDVGRIDELARVGNLIVAHGQFDSHPDAIEAARRVGERFLRGVSVDVDAVEYDMTESGDGFVVQNVTKGRIRAATLVGIPAFAGAEVVLVDDETEKLIAESPEVAASASPITFATRTDLTACPSPVYFAPPELDRRRGVHIEPADDDGFYEVWGHIYGWGECHIGSPPGACIQIPPGTTELSVFADTDGRGVLCSNGELATTGPMVLAADHADLSMSWVAAKSHYDHTGLAVADVAAGEDDHGVWVHGIVRPGVAPEMIHALRASGPSGDWRPIGGRLQLVAILAVNTQGFPALAARVSNGRVMALVASGAPADDGCGCGGGSSEVDELLARLEAQSRAIAELRTLTADARAEAIAGLEAALGV